MESKGYKSFAIFKALSVPDWPWLLKAAMGSRLAGTALCLGGLPHRFLVPLLISFFLAGTDLPAWAQFSWTVGSVGTTDYMHGVSAREGDFVASAYGCVYVSSDGSNWTKNINVGTTQGLMHATLGAGRWVAAGDYGVITYTGAAPTLTWTRITQSLGINLFFRRVEWAPLSYSAGVIDGGGSVSLEFANSQYLAVGENAGGTSGGVIYGSPNGLVWSPRLLKTSFPDGVDTLTGITSGAGLWVAVGGQDIYTSSDGIVWTRRLRDLQAGFQGVAWGNGRFVAVGNGSHGFQYSLDGVTWTPISNPASTLVEDLIFGEPYFVAVATIGQILYSSDGVTWTQQNLGTTKHFKGIAFSQNRFVAVGSEGVVAVSPVSVAPGSPAITAQPQSQTVNPGQTATLNAPVTGTGLSYQWYQGVNGTTRVIPGATTASYTTPAVAVTTSYWVRVSNASGSLNSKPAIITVSAVAQGELDTSFNGTGKVTTAIGFGIDVGLSVAMQADGKIVVAGHSARGFVEDFAVVRYNANGTLDTSFNGTGKVTTPNGEGHSVAVQADGKIIVAGGSSTGSDYDFTLVRYNANGTLDATFNGTGKVTTPIGSSDDEAASVAVQADGKIVVAGYALVNSNQDIAVVRYNPNGTLDTSFNGTGKVTTAIGPTLDTCKSVTVQADGKIVVAGYASINSNNDFAVLRYNANGTLDTSFNATGKVTTAIGSSFDLGESVAVQSNGKIVVAGSSFNGSGYDVALVRYNANGTLDTSFSGTGKVTTPLGSSAGGNSVVVQADGKIVVAGTSNSNFALVRYNADGTLDMGFNGTGKVTTSMGYGGDGRSVAVQPDGKIIIAGSANDDFAVARYNSDGVVTLPLTILSNGVSATGLAGNIGARAFYRITVPTGAVALNVTMAGGSGNLDLYLRHGGPPSIGTYDYRSAQLGNEESISVANPAAGDWYVMLEAYAAYAGAALSASYDIATPPSITAQPQSQTINSGQTATLNVTATGAGLSYQWYQGTSGTTTPVGANSASLMTPPLTATTSYWVRVSSTAGTVNSNVAIVTVGPAGAPSITAHPQSQTTISGQTAALSVTATGAGLNYQWYQGASGVTTTPVGTNSASFTTPALTATTMYWVHVANSAGSVNSNAATIAVTTTSPTQYFWGTTAAGGANGKGTVYKVNAQTGGLTTVVEFDGGHNSGPWGGLVGDRAGSFWGTTVYGGSTNSYGSVYKVNASTGELTTVVLFTGSGGSQKGILPRGELAIDEAGFLWGTTSTGGEYNCGTVYKVNTSNGEFTSLVEFTGNGAINKGKIPSDGLVSDGAGYFWGTTTTGGSSDVGTIFKVNTVTGALTTVVEFTKEVGGLAKQGAEPRSKLAVDGVGLLWGTTSFGGLNYGHGTVFKVNASTGVLTTVVEFTYDGANNRGSFPSVGLVYDGAGFLLGTTDLGAKGYGTVFKVNASTGLLTTLVEFTGNGASEKGAFAQGLVSDGAGSFWGATSTGGASNNGTVYKINASTGALTTLVEFTGNGSSNKGSGPYGPLVSNATGFPTAPTITGEPQNQTINSGQTATLSVTATGAGLSYQWYQGASGTTTAPVGTNSASLTTPALTATTSYWVRVSNTAAGVNSSTAIVTVNATPVPPSITGQPQSQTINSGQTATLNVTATGTGLSYQWYKGASETTTAPVGVNSASFTTPALTATTSYWVRVSNTAGGVNSSTATVTVNPAPVLPTMTGQPQSQTINSGQTATLNVAATGMGLSYQWYQGASGVTTTPVGTNSAGFTTPALTATTSYWVRVSNTAGGVNSSTATVTVNAAPVPPTITGQPQSQTINSGQTATLSVTATGAGLSYQWYQGASGVTTIPVGTNSVGFTTPALTATASYWVRVSNAAGGVNSNTATVTIGGGAIPIKVGPITNPANGHIYYLLEAGSWPDSEAKAVSMGGHLVTINDATEQQWVMDTFNSYGSLWIGLNDAVTEGTFVWSSGESSSYRNWSTNEPNAVSADEDYVLTWWANYGTGYAGKWNDITATTDYIPLGVVELAPPIITTHPSNASISGGQRTTLNVAATGAPLSYQWYIGASGATTSPISGATAARYTTATLTGTTNYWVKVTNAAGSTDSNTATVTVNAPSDKVKPVAQIANPAKGTISNPFTLGGTVKETGGLASLMVSVNGAPAVPAALSAGSGAAIEWSLAGITLENGANNFVVTATDLAGNSSGIAKKTIIYVNPASASMAGSYNAVLLPAGTANNSTMGFLTVNVTTAGMFTGKALIGGVSKPFTGILRNDGTARFKSSSALVDTFALTNGTQPLGSLGFRIDFGTGLTGTLFGESGALAQSAGEVSPYSSKNLVPAALLNQPQGESPSKGYYTVAFRSKAQNPVLAASAYPQGHGYAALTLNKTGVITLAGSLADGTIFTTAGALRADGSVAFFTSLYAKKGGLCGELTFDGTPAVTDVSGANFLWVRPDQSIAKRPPKAYAAGWQTGIVVDAIGTKYAKPTSLDFGQGPANPATGNASLTFTGGLLAAQVSKPVSIDPGPAHGGQVKTVPDVKAPYNLSLNVTTGIFTGTFPHNDGTMPKFGGILINKGVNQGGYGYFLSTPAIGRPSESGSVFLDPKN